MGWKELLQDETGGMSSARTSFWLVLPYTLGLVAADSMVPGVDVPPEAYVLLGSVFVIIGVWAGGPRMMEYVGPRIGEMVGAIAAAAGKGRPANQPNADADDERDPEWPRR